MQIATGPFDAQNGHRGHGRSFLIEELDSSEAADQQNAHHIKRGGVVIEELGSEEGNDQPGKPCNSRRDLQLTSESSIVSLLCGKLLTQAEGTVLCSACHAKVVLLLSHPGSRYSTAQQGSSAW